MSGNTTSNSSYLRRAEMYSAVILDTIKDDFLPEGIHRDVTDFPDGDTLHITTFGDAVIRDIQEDTARPVDPLDTGEITLTITEYKGAGNYITDKMKQDSWKARQFDAALPRKHLRAIKETYETDMLATSEDMQTLSDPNTINGLAHRFVASGASGILDLEDIIYAKLAMDKAHVPPEGRILIIDPIVEATFNNLTNIVNVSNNPRWEGVVETGFGRNMKFVKSVYDFDIYISNRLPHVASESIDTSGISIPAPSGSGTSAADAVVCQFMCVADDMVAPYMGAWRQMPMTEGDRNVQMGRDEFYTTARWGFGGQRPQSLVSLLVNAAAY
jgi:hypothetical protein